MPRSYPRPSSQKAEDLEEDTQEEEEEEEDTHGPARRYPGLPGALLPNDIDYQSGRRRAKTQVRVLPIEPRGRPCRRRQACFETITGMGIQSYRKAILDLAEKLDL